MPPRFYLLHGPDEFASAEFVAELKDKMGDPALASLSTTLFDGRTVTLPDLKSVCDTLPFLTKRRLVIVEGWLTKLMGKSEADPEDGAPPASASTKETLTALTAYLPELPETTALVFVEKRTLPASHAVLKSAHNQVWALIRLFEVPAGPGRVNWIEKRAKAEGGEFSRAAAQALAAAEDDPRALGQEIVKLLTYAAYARPVEAADVELLTPAGGESKIFDMVDAMGQRRGQAATSELHKLLEQQEALYVLSMIVRQFRLILQSKELLEAGQNPGEVAQRLGLHPYAAGKICNQANNFSLPALEHIYHRLLEYDIDIKTGRIEAATALDALVASLTA
jgi:DNA polymerase III subunit delta